MKGKPKKELEVGSDSDRKKERERVTERENDLIDLLRVRVSSTCVKILAVCNRCLTQKIEREQ